MLDRAEAPAKGGDKLVALKNVLDLLHVLSALGNITRVPLRAAFPLIHNPSIFRLPTAEGSQ